MNADTVKSPKEPDYVVIESGKTTLKDLYTKEDWMAVWMGFLLLIAGLLIFLPNPPANMNEDLAKYNSVLKGEAAKAPFKTIEWHKASSIQARNPGNRPGFCQNHLYKPSSLATFLLL